MVMMTALSPRRFLPLYSVNELVSLIPENSVFESGGGEVSFSFNV